MSESCKDGPSFAELVAYERAELPAAEAERIEAHYFGCARCTAHLDLVSRLGRGLGQLFGAGGFPSSATAELVAYAQRRGLQLRSYRLAAGDVVPCTAAPEDDFVVVRLAVDLESDEVVTMSADVTELDSGATYSQVKQDVPVDARTGVILFMFPGNAIRSLPRTRWDMHVRARGPQGERRLGPFTLDHTPWPG